MHFITFVSFLQRCNKLEKLFHPAEAVAVFWHIALNYQENKQLRLMQKLN